jgi:hypothetical protein
MVYHIMCGYVACVTECRGVCVYLYIYICVYIYVYIYIKFFLKFGALVGTNICKVRYCPLAAGTRINKK